MVGELVPYESLYWKLYLLLHKIVDLCCARKIQRDSFILLDSLISEHNRLYLLLSKNNLKPKFHFLTHYGRIFQKNGPIILTSSIRFEAKHKVLMVMHFLTNASLGDSDLKLGLGKEIHPSLGFPGSLITQFPNKLKLECFSYS